MPDFNTEKDLIRQLQLNLTDDDHGEYCHELTKQHKQLLLKYQQIVDGYCKLDEEFRNGIERLNQQISMLTAANKRLLVENTLLNQNNMELSAQLNKHGGSGRNSRHCLPVARIFEK